MPSFAKLSTYHQNVACHVSGILGITVRMQCPGVQQPAKVRPGSLVAYELMAASQVWRETAVRGNRSGQQQGPVHVFPLSGEPLPTEAVYWVSWQEAWHKFAATRWDLMQAGWTVFHGRTLSPKEQVLRADWDQPTANAPASSAGQPHWHFDQDLRAGHPSERLPASLQVETASSSLVRPADEHYIDFVHLAMGTWNATEDHPGCWQRTYNDDCRLLRAWCTKTLQYLKDQFVGR